MQAWTLAASLLKICTNLESFGWELCFGIGGDMWRVSCSTPVVDVLELTNLEGYLCRQYSDSP